VWSIPFIGLCVFTFAIVTFRFPIGELGIAIAIVGVALQRQPLRAPATFWLLVAFVLWAALSSMFSPFPSYTGDNVWERVKLVAIFFLVLNSLRSREQVYVYALFFLAFFVLYPARGAIFNYVGGYTISGRALWNHVYANPNDLAALSLLVLGIALSISTAEGVRRIIRFGAASAAGLLVVVILLTQSRGAFIGLVLGFGFAAWRFVRGKRTRLLAAVMLLAAVAIAVPAGVWERLSGITKLASTTTIAQADVEGSAEQRFEIQRVAWRILGDNLLLGVGPGRYKFANALYAPHIGPKDTHNTYLNLAAELGLPGLVLWIALVWIVLRHGARGWRRETSIVPADRRLVEYVWIQRGLVAFLVAGIFGSYAAITAPYIILAVVLCCAAVSDAASKHVTQAE
jgi:O-antigen ligase